MNAIVVIILISVIILLISCVSIYMYYHSQTYKLNQLIIAVNDAIVSDTSLNNTLSDYNNIIQMGSIVNGNNSLNNNNNSIYISQDNQLVWIRPQ